MASTNSQQDKRKKKKQNKDKKKNNAVATPAKKTPTKHTSLNKTPVKKTPKQDQDKKNKTENGRVIESPEAIPSSSFDSQDTQHEIEEEHSRTTKPHKINKGKQKVPNDEDEEDGSMCKFTMARIKRIIQSEDPSLQLPQDVVFLVNKATEKFIEQFVKEAYDCSVRDRKKALAYKHLSTVVSEKRRFDFLSDYVPIKLKAEAALEKRKLVENGQV